MGCVGKFCTIVVAVASFCLYCCVWGDGAVQLVGVWGVWVNSAQSLWPLPAFVCVVVFGVMCSDLWVRG